MSSSGLRRAKQHSMPSVLKIDGSTRKANWLRNLLDADLRPLIEVVEDCEDRERLVEAERFWIAQFRALGMPLTNCTDGGDGVHGWRPSSVNRARMSAAQRNKGPVSDATRARMSIAQRGRLHRPESRRKIGDAHRGRAKSSETRRRISMAHGGRPFIDETGHLYYTRAEAAAQLRISPASVTLVLHGKYSSIKGHSFRFVDAA